MDQSTLPDNHDNGTSSTDEELWDEINACFSDHPTALQDSTSMSRSVSDLPLELSRETRNLLRMEPSDEKPLDLRVSVSTKRCDDVKVNHTISTN